MWRIILLVTINLSVSFGFKILILLPYFGKSHFNVFEPLAKALAIKGHEVTMVSHFPQNVTLERYIDIPLSPEGIYQEVIDLTTLPNKNLRYFSNMEFLLMDGLASCETLKSKEIKELLQSKRKYDVILYESFISDCYLGLIYKLGSPFIALSTSPPLPWVNYPFFTPFNPSYIPSLDSDFTEEMCFSERALNTFLYFFLKAQYDWWVLPKLWEVAEEALGTDLPNPHLIARNTSLLLMNSHCTLNRPRPYFPDVIEVGGMFLKEEIEKLPKNIEKWINESAHGVIYFSMGSMIKGHSFPVHTRKAFLKAFSRLPQRVLWKWENDSLPEQPSNVMIQKWMPQYDILCHPNVKAYLSHGGLLGTTEAVQCGVPMVVMPQYGDQFVNAAALQAGGGGIILDFKEATEESIYNALKKVLDPVFNKQAKKLSAAFRDRPQPPLETAVYWVEYVARHGGAHHMRTKAVGMPWYQYLLLDVVAFLLAIFLGAMAICFYTTRTICRMVLGGSTEKVKTN